jgi:hypothetical protein
MAVTPNPRDTDGVLLQANITALQAQIAKTSGTATKETMNLVLAQMQRELVNHFMGINVNRLDPAKILSTMT